MSTASGEINAADATVSLDKCLAAELQQIDRSLDCRHAVVIHNVKGDLHERERQAHV